MHILLVEDEPRLAALIQQGLVEEGHAVDIATSGENALDWMRLHAFDAVILDVMLPGMDGFAVCRQLRTRGLRTPILMLTARDAIDDRVTGLDAGADDYLVKPFALAELMARLRALSRRPPEVAEVVLTCGRLRLDPARRQVWSDGQPVDLGAREFRILEYLMQNPNRVMTRDMIANHVWDYDFPNVTNVIDVHIRSLRRKLGDPLPDSTIETVRGAGYRVRTGPS